jgi:putative SOS response-associated peptidase YedK
MCGRFTQDYTWAELFALYQLTGQPAPNLAPSWNVAPTDMAGVVVRPDGAANLYRPMRWGLLPFWSKDLRDGARMINARAETAASKPAFRKAFESRRCLVPAGGFYEWKREGKLKQPWYMTRADGAPLTMAGLWETRRDGDGEPLESFTILTTSANGFMSALHDRMPVILEAGDVDVWLDRGGTDLLKPAPEDALRRWPVSPQMNSVRYNEPDCVAPLTDNIPDRLL